LQSDEMEGVNMYRDCENPKRRPLGHCERVWDDNATNALLSTEARFKSACRKDKRDTQLVA